MQDEIRSTYQSVVADDCFSATSLINQWDDFQECFPEEIWRLDIQRKYLRTFLGTSIDNSKPKSDVQYLRDMMQGRKKYQRRQWIRDQESYFGTKYLMNTVVGDDNRITFRCFTPTGDDVVVSPDYTLKITPYSDMYVSVMFGNGNTKQVRAKGGTEYTIECPLSTMDDTQVTIYGANRIQALNDLSACYIAANNFSMATKLRKLVLGNTTDGYNNSRLTSLTLGNNELLEELDIRNCGSLTGSINLAQCSNLIKLYAEGTKLTGVTFATNGKVQIAHLPSTINSLVMRNLNNLESSGFSAALTALSSLTLEGGLLDNKAIVSNAIGTLQTLYLYNIDWELADTTLLNEILNLFFSLLTGSAYITGNIRTREIDAYKAVWSDLTVNYDTVNIIPQYCITYKNADGTTLYEEWVDRGSTLTDPIEDGDISTPTKESDAQYDYTFAGWDNFTTDQIASSRTITATYTSSIRSYTVTWYQRAGVKLAEQTVEYGSSATYPYDTPTRTDEEALYQYYYLFERWDKFTGCVTGNMDVYAVWQSCTALPAVGTDPQYFKPVDIYAMIQQGKITDYFDTQDEVVVNMGNMPTYDNVTETDLIGGTEKVLDGTSLYNTGVKLFDEDKDWTVFFEYSFDAYDDSSYNDMPLINAYDVTNKTGISFAYNGGVRLVYGGATQSNYFGYKDYRSCTVLRHKKGDTYIYAFTFDKSASDSYEISSYQTICNKTQFTTSNVPLTFGGRIDTTDNSEVDFCKGTIYIAKKWDAYFDNDTCLSMVAWTHETLNFQYITPTKSNLLTSGKWANASFICNQLLEKLQMMNTSNSNSVGWSGSLVRKLLNDKFYYGIPSLWRQLIKKTNITSTDGSQATTTTTVSDYVYLPAYGELQANISSSGYVDEYYKHIDWFTNNTSKIKFRKLKRLTTETVYSATVANDPTLNNNVKEGDIWVQVDNSSIGYYYHNNKWVRSYNWWLRSPSVSYSTYFWNVNTNGYVNNYGANYTFAVCAAWSI